MAEENAGQKTRYPEGGLISIEFDGEKVEIPEQLAVGWRDILRERVKLLVNYKIPVSEKIPAEFNAAVLSDLRQDIDLIRTAQWIKPEEEWQTDAQIYRTLRTRFHPDLYQGESQEVIDLATEYFQALGALKDNGELQTETITVEVA